MERTQNPQTDFHAANITRFEHIVNSGQARNLLVTEMISFLIVDASYNN